MTKETKKNERTTVLSRVEVMSIKTKKRTKEKKREDISNSTIQKDETTVPRRPSIISSESVSV